MDTLALLQHYWWFLISLLGALLVFLLFVQGGQSLLYTIGRTEHERNLIVNSLGRKWELTFTTLVTFGGAFFASFPLFYSTSFGGAFYVWMLILLVFVLQAVSYEYRRKPNNVFGEKTFDWFLKINGFLGTILLGAAVGTFFTGANFTVDRFNMANLGGDTTISQWTTPWHGLEAVLDYRNVALGLAVLFLSRMLALHYFMNDIDDTQIRERSRRRSLCAAGTFLVFFLVFLVSLLFAQGWSVDPATGIIAPEPYKYLHNLLAMPYVGIGLLAGVALVLWSIWLGWRGSRKAIWLSGSGTVLTVLALLLTAGWNDTSYYPSLADMQSSLTIYNSSSSEFTLKAMSIVSLCIPFVVAYIGYAWWALSRKPQDGSKEELKYYRHFDDPSISGPGRVIFRARCKMAKPSIQVFLDKLLQNHRMVLNPVLRGIEQRHIRIGPNAVEKILHGSRTPQLIEVLAPKLRPTACRIPVIPHPQRRRRSDPLRPQIVMKRLFANAPRPKFIHQHPKSVSGTFRVVNPFQPYFHIRLNNLYSLQQITGKIPRTTSKKYRYV